MGGVAPRGWRHRTQTNQHTREVVRAETLSPEAMALITNLNDRLAATELKLAALFDAIQTAGAK